MNDESAQSGKLSAHGDKALYADNLSYLESPLNN